ncbi:MAG: SPOR domain-containing protein [Afipia sp.]|nr:SPOR domain-containing protein [Afipia sp.]
MADRYRDQPYQDDGYGRDQHGAPQQRRAESDPLAELARLIGQTDPFSSFGREQPPAQPGEFHDNDDGSRYEDDANNPPAWMRNVRATLDPAYGDEHQNERRDDRYAENNRHYDQAPRFEPQRMDANNARYDDVLFGQPETETRHDTPFSTPRDRYANDDYDDRHYDDEIDEEPPRRRGGMLSVVVVMLLAVVGTAAAFGYRTFIGSPRSGEPPVIKADTGPTKVMSSAGDKQINDRVGDKPAERVVSREEQPLDVNGKAQPRVVFPPLTQNANPPNAASANTAMRPTGAGIGNGTVTTGGEEPRKIRTLTIRPDQPDSTASAAPAPQPAPAPAAPRAPVASVAPTPAPASNGPMALTPQSAPPAAQKQKVASVSSSSAGAAGSYVQVSSQKTEADAQTSFKAIQSKYSEILGAKSATIRRADLGDKGVFYRALVGPFGTTDEATQFCVNLKAAGGQCIVQRN